MANHPPLSDAPKHVQLAVDLIQLLEENQVEPSLVLDALAIVEHDYRHKLSQQESEKNGDRS